jgi:hypothetical protein
VPRPRLASFSSSRSPLNEPNASGEQQQIINNNNPRAEVGIALYNRTIIAALKGGERIIIIKHWLESNNNRWCRAHIAKQRKSSKREENLDAESRPKASEISFNFSCFSTFQAKNCFAGVKIFPHTHTHSPSLYGVEHSSVLVRLCLV